MRRLLWASVCALFSVMAHAEPNIKTVTIHDYAFEPPIIEIARGDTVVWVNADESPHNIMTVDKKFKSPPLDTKDEYRHVFDQSGSFEYYCQLHPHMKGKVVVH